MTHIGKEWRTQNRRAGEGQRDLFLGLLLQSPWSPSFFELQQYCSLFCYNKIPETGKFMKNRNLFSDSLRGWGIQAAFLVGEDPCLINGTILVSSHGRNEEEKKPRTLWVALIPPTKLNPHDLTTSWRPHLLIHRPFSSNTWILGDTDNSSDVAPKSWSKWHSGQVFCLVVKTPKSHIGVVHV